MGGPGSGPRGGHRSTAQPKRWVGGKQIGYKKMSAKGWYKKSAGRSVLKTIKRLSF